MIILEQQVFGDSHLDIDISPVAHQKLQTEGAMAWRSSEVERCKALFVHLIDESSTLDELIHNHILPVVARHVEGRVSICIGFIDLNSQKTRKRSVFIQKWKK